MVYECIVLIYHPSERYQKEIIEIRSKIHDEQKKKKKKATKRNRRCRGSNPGHPRDRREYLPLYYNDLLVRFVNYL